VTVPSDKLKLALNEPVTVVTWVSEVWPSMLTAGPPTGGSAGPSTGGSAGPSTGGSGPSTAGSAGTSGGSAGTSSGESGAVWTIDETAKEAWRP
jgi:hypothetical protein